MVRTLTGSASKMINGTTDEYVAYELGSFGLAKYTSVRATKKINHAYVLGLESFLDSIGAEDIPASELSNPDVLKSFRYFHRIKTVEALQSIDPLWKNELKEQVDRVFEGLILRLTASEEPADAERYKHLCRGSDLAKRLSEQMPQYNISHFAKETVDNWIAIDLRRPIVLAFNDSRIPIWVAVNANIEHDNYRKQENIFTTATRHYKRHDQRMHQAVTVGNFRQARDHLQAMNLTLMKLTSEIVYCKKDKPPGVRYHAVPKSRDMRTIKAVEMEIDYLDDMMKTTAKHQENPLELKRQRLQVIKRIRADCRQEQAELEQKSNEQEAINDLVERILKLPAKD